VAEFYGGHGVIVALLFVKQAEPERNRLATPFVSKFRKTWWRCPVGIEQGRRLSCIISRHFAADEQQHVRYSFKVV